VTSSESILGETKQEDTFYDAAPLEPRSLYQGEILVDVPFLNMPKDTRWLLLRTKSGRMVDVALQQGGVGGLVKVLDSNQSNEKWYGATDGDFAMARLSKRPVLVLSQNCDLETKQFIQIAPIFPVEGEAAHVEKLRRGDIFSAFWLKAHPPQIKEGYADFELIQAVHRSYITRPVPTEHFRLSHTNIRRLQQSLTRYFGRPNSFDAGVDVAPIAGTYLCVSCFYLTGRATPNVLSNGQDFSRCSVCNGRSWVLQGR
jgi:hypothetical protein